MDDSSLPTIEHYIDGQRTGGGSNRFGDVYDPGTGAVAARVPFATAQDVDQRRDVALRDLVAGVRDWWHAFCSERV